MPLIEYKPRRFNAITRIVIDNAIKILHEYESAGLEVTLRQLYYQFVARDAFPDAWLVDIGSGQKTKNHERNYKKLGEIISDARLAGLIDWNSIVDRTRKPTIWRHDDSPQDAIESAAAHYNLDKWIGQSQRVEVWVEKEALSGVFRRICGQLDVPVFACRGYVSQSAQWEAHQRFLRHADEHSGVLLLHFGDHDPSGIDMTRDIMDRLTMFNSRYGRPDFVTVKRLALNIDQVRKYNPPPSPAKMSDSRAAAYILEFGEDSWELDALSPTQLVELAEKAIMKQVNRKTWDARREQEIKDKTRMRELVATFEDTPDEAVRRLMPQMDTEELLNVLAEQFKDLDKEHRDYLRGMIS